MMAVCQKAAARWRPLPRLAALLLALPGSAFAETLNLTVTAEVMQPVCTLSVGNEEQTIAMGNLDIDKLEAGTRYRTGFTIVLDKCSGGSGSNGAVTAKLKFTSLTEALHAPGWFSPTSGGASGILLGFAEANSEVDIPLGKEITQQSQNGSNIFKFSVVVRRDDQVKPTPGAFIAHASAIITYQ